MYSKSDGELSPEVIDGANRQGGTSWWCVTTELCRILGDEVDPAA
jgi:hypothetical protein